MLLEKVFDNLAMTVNPFATCKLADGWRMRLPVHDWVTMHYALSGGGELKLGTGEVLPLPPNSLAVLPPKFVHAVQCGTVSNEVDYYGQDDPDAPVCELVAGEPQQVSLTVVCGCIQACYAGSMGLFDHLKEAIVINFTDNEHVRGIFDALAEECRQIGPASGAMMTALMNQCLIEVLREVEQQSDGSLPWLSALDDPRLSKVVETILDHPEQNHTLESLADIAAMSRATFIRHFEKSFGRTPMDYVRLRRAAQLLQVSATTVDKVAAKVGYASRSHFSRAFHEQYGVSPADFRKQYH
jgi:AraC-like DNA-binding protein